MAQADGGELGLERLSSADVNGYVLAEASRRSRGHAKGLVCALRSLLRFLAIVGRVDRSLAGPFRRSLTGGCRGCRRRLSLDS